MIVDDSLKHSETHCETKLCMCGEFFRQVKTADYAVNMNSEQTAERVRETESEYW